MWSSVGRDVNGLLDVILGQLLKAAEKDTSHVVNEESGVLFERIKSTNAAASGNHG